MEITVKVPEEFGALAAELGLSAEAYAEQLLETAQAVDAAWTAEAVRRAEAIDAGTAAVVPWEQMEARMRARLASTAATER
jgi:putative addiction module component (TIGR02574 family)